MKSLKKFELAIVVKHEFLIKSKDLSTLASIDDRLSSIFSKILTEISSQKITINSVFHFDEKKLWLGQVTKFHS